ncbi:MAG: lycopene cyclase domain-containing protein [Acidobacteria bacterium]|nr:MAG: lycopene cyclase domain-containing protein [Acidobacteriota bacterium]
MPSARWSYLFLELAVLLTVLLLCAPHLSRVRARVGALISVVVGLFVMWCLVDWIAVSLGIWTFPPGGTLAYRWHGLPLEEYLVFLIHSGVCFLLGALLLPPDEPA